MTCPFITCPARTRGGTCSAGKCINTTRQPYFRKKEQESQIPVWLKKLLQEDGGQDAKDLAAAPDMEEAQDLIEEDNDA